MTRQWSEGQFEVDGIHFRVVLGDKKPRAGDHLDHRLEWLTPVGWIPVRMYAVGLMFDFIAWNEEGLYPSWAGFQGAGKPFQYIRDCLKSSVDHAEAGLRAERAMKQRGLFDEVPT